MPIVVEWESTSGVMNRHRGGGNFEINTAGLVKVNKTIVAMVRPGDVITIEDGGQICVNGSKIHGW